MATVNCTKAASELKAAGEALLQANALLVVIKKAFDEGRLDDLCAPSLVDIGIELTGIYAQRADDSANLFAEANHG